MLRLYFTYLETFFLSTPKVIHIKQPFLWRFTKHADGTHFNSTTTFFIENSAATELKAVKKFTKIQTLSLIFPHYDLPRYHPKLHHQQTS